MASRWGRCFRSSLWTLFFYGLYSHLRLVLAEELDSCESLRLGQYPSPSLNSFFINPKIDEATQEPENCRDMTAWVECLPAPNVTCRLSNGTEFRFSGDEVGFNRTIPCRNVSGYSYKVAVALSLFLGWLGADRFYLGYPALGLLKFCTVGFCGIGTLIDFILIAMQVSPDRPGSVQTVQGQSRVSPDYLDQTWTRPQTRPGPDLV
uniref:TM2 domain-containing protein n=1 Tax=Periophthalmus magnuspinnatus TaxID=409849 RepID=A0A3B4B7Z7_9GOBI